MKQNYIAITTQAFGVAQRVFEDVSFAFGPLGKVNGETDTGIVTGAIFTMLAGEMTGRKRFQLEIPSQDLLGSSVSFGFLPWKQPDQETAHYERYMKTVRSDSVLMQVLLAIKERDQLDDAAFEQKILKSAVHVYHYLEKEGKYLEEERTVQLNQ